MQRSPFGQSRKHPEMEKRCTETSAGQSKAELRRLLWFFIQISHNSQFPFQNSDHVNDTFLAPVCQAVKRSQILLQSRGYPKHGSKHTRRVKNGAYSKLVDWRIRANPYHNPDFIHHFDIMLVTDALLSPIPAESRSSVLRAGSKTRDVLDAPIHDYDDKMAPEGF